MKLNVVWIDVDPYLRAGQQPIYLMERPLPVAVSEPKAGVFNTSEIARVGVFVVPVSSVLQEPIEWSVTQAGQYVRVPIHAYRSNGRSAPAMVATAIHLGLAAMIDCKFNSSIAEITLVLGNQVTDLHAQGADSIRCYVGLAALLKDGG